MKITSRQHMKKQFVEYGLLHLEPEARPLFEFLADRIHQDFFIVPASSSGKYHPPFANGKGGLVRHSITAAHTAERLYNLWNDEDWDPAYMKNSVILAALFHDCAKYQHVNEPEWLPKTTKDHGYSSAAMFKMLCDQYLDFYNGTVYNNGSFTIDMIDIATHAIKYHMSEWEEPEGTPVCDFPQAVADTNYAHAATIIATADYIVADKDFRTKAL